VSIVARAEHFLVRVLPPPIVKSLQSFKSKLPTRLPQAPPIAVMYINDAEKRSYLGLNNFYSFLLSTQTTDATAELTFYSPSGSKVLRHELPLAHFGAATVDVKALFVKKRIDSPFGIVAAQITPRHPRLVTYRELGRVHSQFFAFYEGNGSVAQVHPLSQIGSHNAPGDPFESSQVITTRGLRAIEALQYNPSTHARRLEHRLVDASTGEVVARQANTIAALGACRVMFAISDLARVPDQLILAIDRLPSPNSKPMLRRIYTNGIDTMSHA
jgi:hypothetical protein